MDNLFTMWTWVVDGKEKHFLTPHTFNMGWAYVMSLAVLYLNSETTVAKYCI
jgi:hypothetical protein